MRQKIKYKWLSLILCSLVSVSGYAQEVSKVVDMKTSGTLSYYITDAEKYQITNLTVTGNLDGKDIRFIREMGGRDFQGKATGGKLAVLDLSEADIVKGGESYYQDASYGYFTADNKIGIHMFNQCDFVSVIIPNSVTVMGENAFWGCKNLTSITIPKNVTSIDGAVFANCTNLKAILASEENPNFLSFEDVLFNKDKTTLIAYPNAKSTNYSIPASVVSLGNWAFGSCSALISVTIGNRVTSIGDAAFWNCTSLETIAVLEGNPNYSSFEDVLFNKGKTTLVAYPNAKSTNYSIPANVTSIGRYAFGGCTDLIAVTIPDKVTAIDEFAFYGCTSLYSVTIPAGVASIGGHAFRACTGLSSVTIPAGVTSIGEAAFYGCSGLTSVTIPTSVTSIGGHAFRACSSLSSVTIPTGVTNIDTHVFADCTGLTSVIIPASVTSIAGYAFYGCSSLSSITIPDGVTSLGEGTFAYCKDLATINVPGSVTSVGEFAFYETAWYELQKDGVLYANRVLYQYKGFPGHISIAIKEGTVSICNGAFQGCSDLASVTIPDGLATIGERAFRDCNSLTSITIPGSVTGIGKQAFYGIIGLKKLYSLNTTPPICGESCFWPVKATLYVPTGSKLAYQAADEWKNFNDILETNLSSIPGLNNDEIKVYALPDKIIIENVPEGERISISNLAGQLVYQGTGREVAAGSGTYIVKVGTITRKVMIE